MDWYVYIIHCKDGSYYTGITNALARRIEQHNTGKGAKYTKGRRPVKLVYHEQQQDRSSASMREIEIKSLSREQKENLIKDS
ncbi:MAG: GIY-YIG nuclease family protein [Alphaproteobacteria bacterium]|nr:GIY-YIG nuclease family protein [Alphaproteobacteria bacterium]